MFLIQKSRKIAFGVFLNTSKTSQHSYKRKKKAGGGKKKNICVLVFFLYFITGQLSHCAWGAAK